MSEFIALYTADDHCPKCELSVTLRFVTTKPMRVEPRLTETDYGCRLQLFESDVLASPLQTADHRCVKPPPSHPETLTLGELRRALEQVGDSKPVYLRTFNDRGIPEDQPLHQARIAFMKDGFRVVFETYEEDTDAGD